MILSSPSLADNAIRQRNPNNSRQSSTLNIRSEDDNNGNDDSKYRRRRRRVIRSNKHNKANMVLGGGLAVFFLLTMGIWSSSRIRNQKDISADSPNYSIHLRKNGHKEHRHTSKHNNNHLQNLAKEEGVEMKGQRYKHNHGHEDEGEYDDIHPVGIKNTVFVIWRGVEIVARISPLVILAPMACISSYANELWNSLCGYTNAYSTDEQSTKTADELLLEKINHNKTFIANITWSYTLFTLQYLGPAFVKLGQWAATRRDLFPLHFCIQLSALHSHARTHAFVHTQKALVDSFGEDYESRGLILNDDDIILGSGSVAQVYKATLKNSTTDETKTVAVKVLHPNIRTRTERDLALMQNIANLIDRCIPLQSVKMLSLPRAVANFADLMRRQVDLRVEGDNLDVFRENFKSSSVVRFAEPQRGWVSEQVLVEEYIGDGARPISDFLGDDSVMGLKERKTLARNFAGAVLKMVFTDNFVHSDLHPGNVLVQEATTTGNQTEFAITFLDVGLATSLKPKDRKNQRDLFKAVVLNDGYTAGRLMVERARYERCSSVPGCKEEFASGVQDIVSEIRVHGLTLGAVKIGALMAKMLDLCRIHEVEINPAMASIVISMTVLEGVARSLDPDLNLITAAVPFLVGVSKV